MNDYLKDFIDYEFGCIECGAMQEISYHKNFEDPDLHLCKNCGERYWWSPKQQKLYKESTKEAMPDYCMRRL